MKRLASVGVFFFCLAALAARGEDPPLTFTLEPEKTSYATSDRVVVRLEVENVSGEKVTLVDFAQTQSWLLSAQVVTFEITDADGVAYPLQGPIVDYWPGDRVTQLDKGSKMETALILNDHNARNYYNMGKQSVYTIIGTYHGWMGGSLQADPVRVTLD